MESVWIIAAWILVYASGLVFQLGITTWHVRDTPYRHLALVGLRLLCIRLLDLARQAMAGEGRVGDESRRLGIADDDRPP